MRPSILILGLVAAAHALPAEKRQFSIGDSSTDICIGQNCGGSGGGGSAIITPGFDLPPGFELPPGFSIGKRAEQTKVTVEDIIKAQHKLVRLQQLLPTLRGPTQKAVIQRAIAETRAFLTTHAGITDVSAPPGSGTVLTPGGLNRRSTPDDEDVSELHAAFVKLSEGKPSFPVYMVAQQLAQLLLEKNFDFDPTILGSWTDFSVGKSKRQIFVLPGSCKPEDVIGLETTLATILIIYGPSPPPSIAALRNAVTAALIFCYSSEGPSTGVTPEFPGDGGEVVPEIPGEGGSVVIEEPVDSGIIIGEPVKGDIVVEEPEEGTIIVEEPDEGSIEIEEPEEGSIEIAD